MLPLISCSSHSLRFKELSVIAKQGIDPCTMLSGDLAEPRHWSLFYGPLIEWQLCRSKSYPQEDPTPTIEICSFHGTECRLQGSRCPQLTQEWIYMGETLELLGLHLIFYCGFLDTINILKNYIIWQARSASSCSFLWTSLEIYSGGTEVRDSLWKKSH